MRIIGVDTTGATMSIIVDEYHWGEMFAFSLSDTDRLVYKPIKPFPRYTKPTPALVETHMKPHPIAVGEMLLTNRGVVISVDTNKFASYNQ